MNNAITDYTFTVIEDGQVPLAGEFNTFNYTPVFIAVIIAFLLVAAVIYAFWMMGHIKRVSYLSENSINAKEYYFHPIKLLQLEHELEYEVVGKSMQGIAARA